MNISKLFKDRIDSTKQVSLLRMEKDVLLRILRENTQNQVIQEVMQKIDYINEKINLMQRQEPFNGRHNLPSAGLSGMRGPI